MPATNPYYELPPPLQATVNSELKKLVDKYKIAWEDDSFRFLKNQHRKGSFARQVAGTNNRYEPVYKDLWRFFALTGEYDSMLLLLFPKQTRESKKCPAMSVKACCNFLRWKRNPKGTVLLDGNTDVDDPVINVHTNEPMLSEAATYGANKTLDTAGSAIHNVHETHKHGGSYVEVCEGCSDSFDASWNEHGESAVFTPCRNCQVGSRLATWYRHGNPTKDSDWKNNKATLFDPNYKPNGCSYIDPADVRDLIKALLASNSIAGLKMIVMMLIAIKIFLRADEIVSLGVDSFLPSLFLRINGFIHAIGLTASGKTDKGENMYFNLWRDTEYPELCPVVHLLVYVFKAGIKGGYLFPPDKDLHKVGPADGVYVKGETYQQFLDAFKTHADSVLEDVIRGEGCRVSIHIFRKAGFCFRLAVSLNNEIPNYRLIAFDARHKEDSKQGRTYILDAEQHFSYQKVVQNPGMRVAKDAPPVRIQALHRAEKDCRRNSDATNLSLFELAKSFVESLPCGSNASIRQTIFCARRRNPNTIERARVNFLGSLNQKQLQWYHMLQEAQQHEVLQTEPTEEEPQSAAPPAKRQKQSSTADSTKKEINGRKEVMKAKTLEGKIDKLLPLEEQCPESASLVPFTASATKWVKVTMRPIIRCYRNHHGGDKAAFAQAWKGKFKADFATYCCKGVAGEACSSVANGGEA